MGTDEYEYLYQGKDNLKGPNKPMGYVNYQLIASGRKNREYLYFDDKYKKYISTRNSKLLRDD